MSPGVRKRRRASCLTSCFSSSSSLSPDESELSQETPSISYLNRRRVGSRTVPLITISGDDGDASFKASGDTHSGGSPAGHLIKGDKGFALKSGKEKQSKKPAQQPLAKPASDRTQTRASPTGSTCLIPAELCKVEVAKSPPHPTFNSINPATCQPERTAGPVQSPPSRTRRFDPVDWMLILSATLTVMLSFGRVCAVLCICTWLYLLSSFRPPPPPSPPAAETSGWVDMDSPEYKQKVVLMGLLERNRVRLSFT